MNRKFKHIGQQVHQY